MIIVQNRAAIINPSRKELIKLKKLLTVENPEFKQAKNLGLATWHEKHLHYYKEKLENIITIPVGALPNASRFLKGHAIHDLRFTSDSDISLKFTGKLRDYQAEAVKVLLPKTVGIVCAKTGSGKTIIMLKLIAERKQPTLVLVHTTTLLEQFKERLLEFTDLPKDKIGVIGGGMFSLGPVTVATLQTMSKTMTSRNLSRVVNSYFGQVLCDEVHIIPAKTFFKTIDSLRAKYKHGFSATPVRTDGLDVVINFAAGPLVHKISEDKLSDYIVKPAAEYVFTSFDYPLFEILEYQHMITTLATDEARNKLIIKTTQNKENAPYQKALLCGRVAQAKLLHKQIPKSEILVGSSTKKHKIKVIERLRSGKLQTVISTYQCFGTGTDIPGLEMLVMCSPIKSHVLVKQCAGRLMRTQKGKRQPKILVFVDKEIPLLKRQYYSVRKTLKSL